ncbi:unnamed protein product [Allacma fusca]|uniref:CARD domain-containing protein n=1 Tax=Allacma fusca TaxID=39272 RepID=A0A8J2L8V2_9HEXA|nr:unnamed protein product [Allacma fusca]
MGERIQNTAIHVGDTPGNPIPPEILELQNKVKRKTKELKELGEDFPQRELLRRKLTQFYESTTNPDGLADHLYQTSVLNNYQRQKIKNEKMDYDKNDILYDIVTSKEAIVDLLPALKKSGNDHILNLIDTLAS